jgi:hypothetical protein
MQCPKRTLEARPVPKDTGRSLTHLQSIAEDKSTVLRGAMDQ